MEKAKYKYKQTVEYLKECIDNGTYRVTREQLMLALVGYHITDKQQLKDFTSALSNFKTRHLVHEGIILTRRGSNDCYTIEYTSQSQENKQELIEEKTVAVENNNANIAALKALEKDNQKLFLEKDDLLIEKEGLEKECEFLRQQCEKLLAREEEYKKIIQSLCSLATN